MTDPKISSALVQFDQSYNQFLQNHFKMTKVTKDNERTQDIKPCSHPKPHHAVPSSPVPPDALQQPEAALLSTELLHVTNQPAVPASVHSQSTKLRAGTKRTKPSQGVSENPVLLSSSPEPSQRRRPLPTSSRPVTTTIELLSSSPEPPRRRRRIHGSLHSVTTPIELLSSSPEPERKPSSSSEIPPPVTTPTTALLANGKFHNQSHPIDLCC